MNRFLFLIFILVLGALLAFKIIKLLLPILLFFFIWIVLGALFRTQRKPPEKKGYQGEEIKEVEIRVIEDDIKETDEKIKAKKGSN